MIADPETVLRYFTGKARVGAEHALSLLAQSEAQEYWLKGASRSVKALLNKQITRRIANAKPFRAMLEAAPGNVRGASIDFRFGVFAAAEQTLATLAMLDRDADLKSRSFPPAVDYSDAVAQIRVWAEAWLPIAKLVAELDARRPKPVLVCKTLSPSVLANLQTALGLNLATVCVPEMRTRWVEVVLPSGNKVKISEVYVVWPDGTQHGRSRFSGGSAAGNKQCEACGHAIRDPYNWVPLLAHELRPGTAVMGVRVEPDTASPVSLWVGKDCARKIFGCDVSGEAIYSNRCEPAE